MLTEELQESITSLQVKKEILVAAPADIVFETILEQPPMEGHPLDLKLEPWVGGRWFRDLGNKSGHLWGHVQVIKPPKLLELCGPMMMSYPALSHVQYRLTETSGGTKIELTHQAMGLLRQDHRDGVGKGWQMMLDSVKKVAESKKK